MNNTVYILQRCVSIVVDIANHGKDFELFLFFVILLYLRRQRFSYAKDDVDVDNKITKDKMC